jgi:hypothetical protein
MKTIKIKLMKKEKKNINVFVAVKLDTVIKQYIIKV